MSLNPTWSTESRTAKDIQKNPDSNSQNLKIKDKEFKVRSLKKNKITQRAWILSVIMFSLNCLNAEKGATTAKRYLFINAAELI